MTCSSANQFQSASLGDLDTQIASSRGGVLNAVAYNSANQGSMATQLGGRGRRTRRHIRRRSNKHKHCSHKRKSRKIYRRRK
jgi:hypothetical protein